MQQVFIAKSPELADELAFERKLFVIRKLAHTAIRAANVDVHWYVASISARTLAVLDRNGLRPGRYYVTTDDLVIMASEAGVLTIPPEKVVTKGRLEPGKMFMVDTVAGRIVSDEEIKHEITSAHPYHLTVEMTTNIERVAVCANK